MELIKAVTDALEATARLREAMTDDDPATGRALLEERGRAMENFETCHRGANPQERSACADLVQDLIEQDRQLRAEGAEILGRLASEFRGNLGTASSQSQFYAPIQQACVDRKA